MEQVVEKSKKPSDNPFTQQKMKMWQPIMTPTKVVIIFIAIGVAFIPTGVSLIRTSNNVYESTITYDQDGSTNSCAITTANEGKSCTLEFTLDEDVHGDLYVYYELENYYQNHRRYVSSRYASQLEGGYIAASELSSYCDPMTKNGSLTLNPCGLIANSYFTDIISCSTHTMDESDIAWSSDDDKFVQPQGFEYSEIEDTSTDTCSTYNLPTDCKTYCSGGTCYFYYYPNDDTTQYLYESYPSQITPIEGVTNEHFKVWMRTAALSEFRKLYGVIDGSFSKGEIISFTVNANYEVQSFSGKKTLVISTVGEFGGRNPYLGVSYIVVGTICVFFGILFATKQLLFPRPLGDPDLLPWS